MSPSSSTDTRRKVQALGGPLGPFNSSKSLRSKTTPSLSDSQIDKNSLDHSDTTNFGSSPTSNSTSSTRTESNASDSTNLESTHTSNTTSSTRTDSVADYLSNP